MMKTKLFLALCFLIPNLIWLILGDQFALNFTFALFSFLLIALSVFYVQKNKILELINNASKDELEVLVETYKSKQEKLEEEFFINLKEDSKLLEAIESKNSTKFKNIKKHSSFFFFLKDSTEICSQKKRWTKNKKNLFKKQKFWNNFSVINAKIGIKTFFLPLRLLTYAVLVVGILILIHHQLFNTLAFFSGLIFANIFLIFGIIFGVFKVSKEQINLQPKG